MELRGSRTYLSAGSGNGHSSRRMEDKLHSGPNQGKVVNRGDGKHIPIMIATPHLPALVLKPPTNPMTKYLYRICPKCKDYLGMESYEVQTDQLFWYQQEPWR